MDRPANAREAKLRRSAMFIARPSRSEFQAPLGAARNSIIRGCWPPRFAFETYRSYGAWDCFGRCLYKHVAPTELGTVLVAVSINMSLLWSLAKRRWFVRPHLAGAFLHG